MTASGSKNSQSLVWGWALGGLTAVTFSAAIVAGVAAKPSEGGSLAGSWRGGGTVKYSTGNKEKIRCRATFRPAGSGYSMSANCASASGNVAQTASLKKSGANRWSGGFSNPQYGISGAISVTLAGSSISVSLNGGGASAFISMRR